MNKKDERFISIAREVSNLSDYRKIKIGAVIVLKREIISVGYNKHRELKDGSLGNCFPCPACQRRIITAGIKRIVYTDYNGIYEMKIRRFKNAKLQSTKI